MSKFVLIFSGGYPKPEDQVAHMKEWEVWNNKLVDGGVVDSGFPFGRDNKVVTGPENTVSDYKGYSTGYMVVNADSMDDAIAIAKDAPHQKLGGRTKVFWTMTM